MADKKPFHEVVATRIIEQLQQGTAPWLKPWRAGAPGSFMPKNPVTGKRYKGINALHLLAQERPDSRWMTYKQALSCEAQVRKGERGTSIQYWKFTDEETRLGEDGRPVRDADGKEVKDIVRLERPRVFFATVFNAEQIEGLPPLPAPVPPSWDPYERAESILVASGAKLLHDQADRAFYRLGTDSIHLPAKGQFDAPDRYYATALHELGHWTGHPTRLDRDVANPFGSEAYAKEELRAEIASMILGDELGIGHDPGQHVAYVGSWIKVLQEEPLEVFRAAAAAEKIRDYVLATDLELKAQRGVVGNANESSHGVDELRGESGGAPLAPHAPLPHEARVARQNANLEAVLGDPDILRRSAELERQGAETQASSPMYLQVPFVEKNAAKELGARWDRQRRAWYVPSGVDPSPFARWSPKPYEGHEHTRGPQVEEAPAQERRYLAVPYMERTAARAAGALWDKAAKSWYAGPKADLEAIKRWAPEDDAHQAPAMHPREEFAEVLRSVGCDVSEPHPIMDGQRHRVRAEGDKKGELAGFYVGHLDGHPAGYVRNNRTGAEAKWKAKGYHLAAVQRSELKEEAAAKQEQRAAEQAKRHELAAERVAEQLVSLVPARAAVGYLRTKGIQAHAGVWTDKDGETLYVPGFDATGKQWTTQYIHENGTKRFAKDSRKEGCFHPVGGMNSLDKAAVILVAEGYATAATLTEATGHAAVAAFDCGNLVHVAQAIRQQWPSKTILVAGDNDLAAERAWGNNPGRLGAEAAAQAIGARAVFPTFAPGECASDGQLTDFNDLAHKSTLGAQAICRQIDAALEECNKRQMSAPRRESERQLRLTLS